MPRMVSMLLVMSLLSQARDADSAATVIAEWLWRLARVVTSTSTGVPLICDGSISRYTNAAGQARRARPSLSTASDGKFVEAWGGYRNEAAHDPGGRSLGPRKTSSE
jgi:hypothetical protein